MPRASSDSRPDRYDESVFINCPFDAEYKELLRPLVFTVVFAGFEPLLSSLTSDSGENRLDKICGLILSARYSIHDLSRLKSEKEGDFQRMNMPFELGVDYGTRQHGEDHHRDKRFLILEEEQHRYKIALSDLSGVDIKVHENDALEIIRCVRDWFYETLGMTSLITPGEIWIHFTESFNTWLYEERSKLGIPERQVERDLKKMSISEYIDKSKEWVASHYSAT